MPASKPYDELLPQQAGLNASRDQTLLNPLVAKHSSVFVDITNSPGNESQCLIPPMTWKRVTRKSVVSLESASKENICVKRLVSARGSYTDLPNKNFQVSPNISLSSTTLVEAVSQPPPPPQRSNEFHMLELS